NVEQAIHLFERRLFKGFGNGRAGVVHQDVESAERFYCFLDRGFARLGIRGVRLNGDRLSAVAFNLLNYGRGGISTFGVGDRYLRPVYGQTFGDGGADTARAAGDKRNFSLQSPIHGLSPVSFKVVIHCVSIGIKRSASTREWSNDLFTYRYETGNRGTARTASRL